MAKDASTVEPPPPSLALDDRSTLLVDSVRDYAIVMLDPQGNVQSWNEGAERLKGHRASEILGQHVSRFYTPEDLAANQPARLLRLAERDGRAEDEGWRVRKDGSRFWADVSISAIRDKTGQLVGYAKITRDHTERKKAEDQLRESEALFRQLVGSVKDYAIVMLDPQGRVQTWNEGAERLEGYRAEEIVGQHVSRFYPPEEVVAGAPSQLLAEAEAVGRVERQGWRVRKDGTRFWADVALSAVRDTEGWLRGFSEVTRDLTAQRNAEDERVRLAQAQEALRLRDEFLSIASHELKTPLTALQLHLQSMRGRVAELDEQMSVTMDRATRSSNRLAGLVETLLDVARISTGRLAINRQTMDLGEAVLDLLDRMRAAATGAGCALTTEVDTGVVGLWDPLRLEQIVSNVVSNAFKYAAGTGVCVCVRREQEMAVIEVKDGGPGIPESALPRIFHRFERAASVKHYGGLGLGLYVTREIAEAHGGTVSAANLPERGTRITVRLPLSA